LKGLDISYTQICSWDLIIRLCLLMLHIPRNHVFHRVYIFLMERGVVQGMGRGMVRGMFLGEWYEGWYG